MSENNHISIIEKLFKEHFTALTWYAKKIIADESASKEIVHQVFVNVWESRETLELQKPMKSYLYTAVHNRCLNYIRDNKKFESLDVHAHMVEQRNQQANDYEIGENELETQLSKAIAKLPEKCRQVFELSRFEELKYAEISAKLNISVKTVEAQISKALKFLKTELKDYMHYMILLYYLIKNFFNQP